MILQEVTANDRPLRVDREKGIIYDVKIIGVKSANKRTYPVDVLAKAAPLYEDATVNINHPVRNDQARGVEDTFGAVRGVRVKATGDDPGLYGDLHYLKEHALAGRIAEHAERFANKIGLSHNADGTGRQTADGFLVESINRVISVDLVKDPATNKSLFEELEPMKLKNFKLTELVAKLPLENVRRQELAKLIEEGAMSGDTVAATEDQPGPEEAIKAAFRAEIIKAFDDTSLDAKATLARIKEVIKAHEKVQSAMAGTKAASDGGGEAPAESAKEVPTAEGKDKAELGSLMEEVKLLRARDEVRTLLAEARKEVTAEEFAAICDAGSAHRKTLIESLGKPVGGGKGGSPSGEKPRTTGSSSATGGGKDSQAGYEKGKAFMEHLRRQDMGSLTVN